MRDTRADSPPVEREAGPFCVHPEHGPMDGCGAGYECPVCEWIDGPSCDGCGAPYGEPCVCGSGESERPTPRDCGVSMDD